MSFRLKEEISFKGKRFLPLVEMTKTICHFERTSEEKREISFEEKFYAGRNDKHYTMTIIGLPK